MAIWEDYSEEITDEHLVSNVATNFRLPQRDIRRAVETARYLCRTGADIDDFEELDAGETVDDFAGETDVFAPVDGKPEREHCYEACKRYSASNFEALAELMTLRKNPVINSHSLSTIRYRFSSITSTATSSGPGPITRR
ncbi:hypothetical protein C482_05236 [Natrialba chahannaoensis JCM 10990]|uniref:Uncharacterized protein n=1 Tax=Natrialba chahannaoensis JCM 10990 TaxID=1227492 RepID=M0AZ85_9EURY|nr:hypothetical protein C482_05236 [Natrialba chahannaoensis JCM 10990]